jgi:hypothetical protein
MLLKLLNYGTPLVGLLMQDNNFKIQFFKEPSHIKVWIGYGSERMVGLYTHLRPKYRSQVLDSIPSLVGNKTDVIDPVDPLFHKGKVA